MSQYFSDKIMQRGYQYYREHRVYDMLQVSERHFSATVQGNYPYFCEIHLDKQGDVQDGTCTCPYHLDYNEGCKHQAALWYAVKNGALPKSILQVDELEAKLNQCDESTLRQLVQKLMANERNCLYVALWLNPQASAQDCIPIFQRQVNQLCANWQAMNIHEITQWLAETAKLGEEHLAHALPILIQRLKQCLYYIEVEYDDAGMTIIVHKSLDYIESLLKSRTLSVASRQMLLNLLLSARDDDVWCEFYDDFEDILAEYEYEDD